MKNSIFLALLVFFTITGFNTHIVEKNTFSHIPVIKKTYHPAVYTQKKLDSLKKHYGQNKTIPDKYVLPILLALSHYPELKEEQITFRLNTSDFPMAARPKVGKMIISNKQNRTYLIMISVQPDKDTPELWLKNLHLNAQVGLIGHELGHILQYSKMSKTKILGTAFNYLFASKREALEKDADQKAIEHGLGWQLYDWASTIRKDDRLLSSRRYINRFYMTPGRIKGYMWELGYYEPEKPESHLID